MEVYLPGAGWVEFDPTNGIIGTERLIRVAVGRDPEQAMPIKGTFTGAANVGVNTLVDVQVRTLTPTVDAVAEAPPPPPGAAAPTPPPTAPAQAPITQS
jgi:transglutaminase-like putative cysteine protease